MKPVLKTTKYLKNTNIHLVKSALKEMEAGTKAELSHRTGLSLATCNTILNELEEKGEVRYACRHTSVGGRPAKTYSYNVDYAHVLCAHIHLESRHFRLGYTVSNLAGTPLAWDEVVLEEMSYQILEDTLLRILYDHPKIRLVGLGLPCVVSEGGVVTEGSLPKLNSLPLEEKLSERLGVYVQAGNDVNYLAYGFYKNRGRMRDSIVYLYYPPYDLPGCGIVLDGLVFRGSSHFAGEISYLTREAEPVLDQAVRIITALTTILNPNAIAVSGSRLGAGEVEEIRRLCGGIIPHQHMAQIVYREEPEEDYIRGLADLSVDSYENRQIYSC